MNDFPNKCAVLRSLHDNTVKYHSECDDGKMCYYMFNDKVHDNGIVLRLTYVQEGEGYTYQVQAVYPMNRFTNPAKFLGRTTYEVRNPNNVGALARTMLNSPKWYVKQMR